MDFRLLGPLEVSADGAPLPLGGRKQGGILALLLLHANEVVSVDRLVDELWGEQPPRTVEAYVQNCVSRLRRVLGRERIETRAPGYLLRVAGEDVDAFRFEHAVEAAADLGAAERAAALREALALWRGPALADFTFEPFARPEIERLEELRLTAIEARVAAELELGRHDALLAELEALARRHPGRERLRYLQMLALYRAGRQREALLAYQDTRLELVEQFGLDPGDELRALERMILSHDPSLRLAPAAPPVPGRARTGAVLLSVELVVPAGEKPEAAQGPATGIAAIVERHGGLVRSVGPAGIVSLFGAAGLHEDDAIRALRAAAELRARLPPRVEARIAVDRVAPAAAGTDHAPSDPGLLASAAAGETVVGASALGLVAHAVDVVAYSSAGRYRVLRFDPEAEGLPRRLDSPLVGRRGELDRLASELDAAVAGAGARRLLLLGEAGIGKTRLANEFVAGLRSKARLLTVRCSPTLEGLDPLGELVAQAGPPDELLTGEPDAEGVLETLRERSQSGRGEELWAVRRLFEALARNEPLLVVLDDVHWAPHGLLDLVEYLVGWATRPMLVVCLARPELLEERPGWQGDALPLGPLSRGEAEQLVDALPGRAELSGAEIATAMQAAEGNPLYLEQLVAAARESPLDRVPPTIELLVARRVDRLDEPERRVLERASVVGPQFWRRAVEAASPAAERGGVGAALMALVRRRFVHPEPSTVPGEDGFRFHHGLIREAVYAGLPAPVRAELHEAIARSLPEDAAELDPLIGYHLEQAARERPAVAAEAGRRLGVAGVRALKRVDSTAARDLLTRASSLLPEGLEKLELDWALATAIKFAGESAEAVPRLDAVAARAARSGDRAIELRARVEQVWPNLATGRLSLAAAVELLAAAIPELEAAGDDFGLGRAWDVTGAVEGVYRNRYRALVEAERRASVHYERVGFTRGASAVRLAGAACLGPTPVPEAVAECETLLAEAAGPVWSSFILPFVGVLQAMTGDFDGARRRLAEARESRREFADLRSLATSWAALAADVELLAGEPDRAVEILSDALEVVRKTGDPEWLATNGGRLAEAQLLVGQVELALAGAEAALTIAPEGHLTARAVAERVRAQALARSGALEEAKEAATIAVASVAGSDALDQRARAAAARAEVLGLAGAGVEAARSWAEARALFEQKGNLVAAAGTGGPGAPDPQSRLSTRAGTA